MKKERRSSVALSKVSVLLKKDGNIELEYSSVPADKFREVMEKDMPDYENTELLYSFMRRLEKVTEEYITDVNRTI